MLKKQQHQNQETSICRLVCSLHFNFWLLKAWEDRSVESAEMNITCVEEDPFVTPTGIPVKFCRFVFVFNEVSVGTSE